jgi:tRNA threonylcarbamoyladenosine biosynthesis protein TsaB
VLAEVAQRSGTGHAGVLPALISRALEKASVSLIGVEALAVSLGPGSFTGLRVGLSFAKGIALANGARMIGVPTLEALACAAPARFDFVAVVCDARRNETYTTAFRRSHGWLERVAPDLALSPGNAAAWVAARVEGERAILVGDAPERYPESFEALRGRVAIACFEETHPSGSIVALLGEARLHRGEWDPFEGLVPSYVRASAAERNLGRVTLTIQNAVS